MQVFNRIPNSEHMSAHTNQVPRFGHDISFSFLCRTLNRENPGSNLLAAVSKLGLFRPLRDAAVSKLGLFRPLRDAAVSKLGLFRPLRDAAVSKLGLFRPLRDAAVSKLGLFRPLRDAAVSKLGLFRPLRDAAVHSALQMSTWLQTYYSRSNCNVVES